MTKSRNILAKRRQWTAAKIALLRRDYPDKPAQEIAAVEQQRIALDTAFDLLESAQPADHLESSTPEDWYTERDAWKKRNDGSAPEPVKP